MKLSLRNRAKKRLQSEKGVETDLQVAKGRRKGRYEGKKLKIYIYIS